MNQKKIREAKGNGTFQFKNSESKSEFHIEFYIGQEPILYLHEKLSSPFWKVLYESYHKQNRISVRLNGVLENGNYISIDELILVSIGGIIKGKQAPLKFKVFSNVIISSDEKEILHGDEEIIIPMTNLEFLGCDKTISPKGGFVHDRFSVKLEGFEFTIKRIEEYSEVMKDLKAKKIGSAVTAEIIVKTQLKNGASVYSIADDICWLLSLAKGKRIVPIGRMHYKGGKRVWAEIPSAFTGDFDKGTELIRELPPENLRYFLQKTYPNYKKFKHEFGLKVIFEYYLFMKSFPMLDIRCLMGFILLESLASHAQEHYSQKGLPIENSLKKEKIKKLHKILPKNHNLDEKVVNNLIEEFVYQYPTLQDSITYIMNDFGMEYKEKETEIFKLRKEFIHKGMYPKETKEHIRTYRTLIHFIDRLILHILDYDGPFLNIANGYREEKIYKIEK